MWTPTRFLPEAVADLLCCYDDTLELTADGGPR